jgi:hypothetical protein
MVPFYVDHIRQQTIMGKLQSIICSKGRGVTTRNSTTCMVKQILSAYNSPTFDSQGESLYAYHNIYGTDVVRKCVIFSQDDDTDLPIREQSLIDTKKWFERVWDAVRFAHGIYDDTQAHAPLETPDLESRNDPHITDDIIDYDLNLIGSMVHVPPPSPTVSNMGTGEDTFALWLASQEAILSMTGKETSVNYHKVREQLTRLMVSIARYEEEHGPQMIDCSVHYYSTRILISLLATVVPSFAEECWLALHYGQDQGCNKECHNNEETDAESSEIYEDLIEYGYQHLPRRSDPSTLPSIFSQPFPVPESSEVLEVLKSRSAESVLRRIADREAKNNRHG